LLTARDDPLIDPAALPREQAQKNPNLILAITDTGGHMGWPTGLLPIGDVSNFADRAAVEYIRAQLSLRASKEAQATSFRQV
jgi:predicted alpha/beta-fold hydrolase